MDGYTFRPPVMLSDDTLTALYEGNGLFAKIIDIPAEETTRRLPALCGDKDAAEIVRDGLDCLAWEEQALTAVRWARLFGGSIAVMLVDDGGRLEDPLKVERVQSVDDLRVYPRSQVSVDLSQAQPEYFHVSSRYGDFTVHESRCLLFRNDPMPESSESPLFQFWGVPEAYRISAAVDRAALASEQAVRMLDASIQAVYRLKGASAILATDDGEQHVMQRLQVIDAARSAWNAILLDADSEDYSFIAAGFDGKGEVAEFALRYLAAVSRIPPEVLYGYHSQRWWRNSSPAAQETFYNYVEGIQHRMLRDNAQRLISLILRAEAAAGNLRQIPPPVIDFPPLWSESASEKATAAMSRATAQLTRAKTIQTYMEAGAVGRQDVRPLLKRLKKSERNT